MQSNLMKPTLVILAAGMGSRYGGLKQLDEVGPGGEAIIDYSLYDAIRAGFGKVVFVIRTDFDEAFKERFEPKLKGRIAVEYGYQSIDKIPSGFDINPDREKPWGTCHALLMAESAVKEPMAVINADDYYGKEAYKVIADFLTSSADENEYAMVGYSVGNTLSEFGSVSRGVCNTDENGYLTNVVERLKIKRNSDGIFYYEDDKRFKLEENAPVSMNFWGLKPSVFRYLHKGFGEFLSKNSNKLKSEYFIPLLINDNIIEGNIRTRVLKCDSEWFGITYKEDKPFVQQKIIGLLKSGEYPEKLWK
jgi:NDP-sugar pyrophosphorylase family protein